MKVIIFRLNFLNAQIYSYIFTTPDILEGISNGKRAYETTLYRVCIKTNKK